MSNSTVTNPVVIDTFSADVTIKSDSIMVSSIIMEGATAGDTAVFIDKNSVEVLRLSNAANGASISWSPAEPFTFRNGLIFDDSASSLASGDYIYIYLA